MALGFSQHTQVLVAGAALLGLLLLLTTQCHVAVEGYRPVPAPKADVDVPPPASAPAKGSYATAPAEEGKAPPPRGPYEKNVKEGKGETDAVPEWPCCRQYDTPESLPTKKNGEEQPPPDFPLPGHGSPPLIIRNPPTWSPLPPFLKHKRHHHDDEVTEQPQADLFFQFPAPISIPIPFPPATRQEALPPLPDLGAHKLLPIPDPTDALESVASSVDKPCEAEEASESANPEWPCCRQYGTPSAAGGGHA